MKIRLFFIATIGLFFSGVCGENYGEKTMKKLTIKELELQSNIISIDMKTFEEQEDILVLSKVVNTLKTLDSYEKPETNEWVTVRNSLAELWIRIIRMIDAKIDYEFNIDDVPEMNIVAPGAYPSGISPTYIKEPELRKQYEQAIATNKRKADKYLFQIELRKIKREIFKKAAESLVALYSEPPEDIAELKKLLQSHGIEKRFDTKISKTLISEQDGI